MKKIFQYVAILVAGFSLMACDLLPGQSKGGGTPAEQKEAKSGALSASNKEIEMKVKGGQYILPSDGKENSKYLALELEIKNKSDETVRISPSDIDIYNPNGEKVKLSRVSDYKHGFETIQFDNLSAGKSLSGYLVFEVETNGKYELEYEKKIYNPKQKIKGFKLTIDPAKYPNQVAESKKLAFDYLNTVFLGGKAKSKDEAKSSGGKEDFVLGGDLSQNERDFRAAFTEDFKRKLHDYPFTDDEVNAFIDSYVEMNAKRAEISYRVTQYLPNSVVIKIRPKTISLSRTILNHRKAFYEKHRSEYANLTEINKAIDKNYADVMTAGLDSHPLLTTESEYQLTFVKTDGKWVVEPDYTYDSIVVAFEGDIS